MSDRPPVNVKFIGGAQEEYKSFKNLSITAMDMYSPKWRDYDHHKSYMFPPVYSYGRPELSDHMIEAAKKKDEEQDGCKAEAQGSSSTCPKERKDLKKKTQEQGACTTESKRVSNGSTRQTSPNQQPTVCSHDSPDVSDQLIEDMKDMKEKKQEQDGSTAEAQGSDSTCKRRSKALKKKPQEQEGSRKGNSIGSTSQKLDSVLEKGSNLAGHRVGDKAEHIVYDALEAVSHLASISPMVIINSLDLERIKTSDKIFQNQVKLGGEYDFVIIGPKVGIVVIEVKNAKSKGSYVKGLSQLRSFEDVIDFLKLEYPEVPLPKGLLVRKLLIFLSSHKKPQIDLGNQQNPEVNYQATKDMERKPQEQEVSLAESERKSSCSNDQKPDFLPETVKNVANKVKHDDTTAKIRIWDQGDIRNSTFYSKFYDFFHETGYNISKDVYESLAPILVGLASFLTFKTSSSSVDLRLDLLKISETAALTFDAWRMQKQKTEAVKGIPKLKTIKNFNIVLLRTPDQQIVLDSPSPRQFIIGVAGTGKTIILQQKALRMLKDKKKVLILTAST